ncbi:response regulator transcription factor [Geotalea uraniireducens]|uniref:Response regulator receiver protein n=1 Tax=Geotalea uraniireducens (strain Rf4) TaxID=351605 RepID=A5G4S9_GEOUR|nr:LuxR C-terminal-related transcriptional regulator [Geotalea uraniireducens]ABQ26797.1 response regulator receiver protein [Geotalea uraniireducens Rf4]
MTVDNPDTTLSTSSSDCLAFIVGPNHFQNTLLSAYIETHSKWKSSVVESIAAIPHKDEKEFPGHTAVLFDCFGLSSDNLSDNLLAELEQFPSNWAKALFNLDRHSDFEKKSLEYGVQGFFYNDDTVETLLKGLTAVFGGEFWVSRQKMAETILENGFRLRRMQIPSHVHIYPHDLTQREVELLGLLTLGSSNEVIADKLFISPHTVRTHLNHIFKKINVSSRLEASIWASETLFVRKHW